MYSRQNAWVNVSSYTVPMTVNILQVGKKIFMFVHTWQKNNVFKFLHGKQKVLTYGNFHTFYNLIIVKKNTILFFIIFQVIKRYLL